MSAPGGLFNLSDISIVGLLVWLAVMARIWLGAKRQRHEDGAGEDQEQHGDDL